MGSILGFVAALAIFPVPLPGQSQPAWSPDAADVAFASATGRPGHAARRAEIDRLRLGTRGMPGQLTRGGGYNTGPAWSPDGGWIAYLRTSYDRRHGALMLMRSDGGGKRVLVQGRVSRPAWSPDGAMLAYVAEGRLRVLGLATGAVRDLGTAPGMDPAWSPDGSRIAFAGPCTVYVFDLQTGATAPSELIGCFPELTVGAPSWLEGGARIAFSLCENWRRCELAFVRPGSRDVEVSKAYVGPDTAWAPDGSRLAWSCLFTGGWALLIRDRRLPGVASLCT